MWKYKQNSLSDDSLRTTALSHGCSIPPSHSARSVKMHSAHVHSGLHPHGYALNLCSAISFFSVRESKPMLPLAFCSSALTGSAVGSHCTAAEGVRCVRVSLLWGRAQGRKGRSSSWVPWPIRTHQALTEPHNTEISSERLDYVIWLWLGVCSGETRLAFSYRVFILVPWVKAAASFLTGDMLALL